MVGASVAHTELVRHQRMIFFEGIVLMAFLLGGGIALFYFSYRTYKEKSAKEKFFASFAHDLKTAMFRLQLQIEKLGKSLGEDKVEPVLVQTRKLHLHLENSLDYALGDEKNLYIEKIEIQDFFGDLHHQWPELRFKVKGKGLALADRKALNSIFKNLLHNSFVHGHAKEVALELSVKGRMLNILYKDDGQVFEGNLARLSSNVASSYQGSGFGLFLVRYWLDRLHGELDFTQSEEGRLHVNMQLPTI